jgi:hypothetical protein
MLLLLLLTAAVFAIPINPLPPVRLELVDENFVQLFVGSPPRLYSFFVSLHLSDVELHSNQIAAQSHSLEALSDSHGTELFSLDKHRLRLPFIYIGPALAHTVHLTTSLSAAGTLGLGPLSPLWRYWRNFTYTKESILLGAYDSFLQMRRERAPAFAAARGLANGIPFQLDYLGMDSQLPHELFQQRPSSIELVSTEPCGPLYSAMHLPGPCRNQVELPFGDQHIHLLTGVYYAAVQRSHDGTVYFGRRFLSDMVLFSDPLNDAVTLTLSATSFHHAETTAIFTTLLLLLAGVWTILALNRPQQKSGRVYELLNLYLEAMVYITALASWVVQFVGFRWTRFLDSFVRTDAFFLFFYLMCTSLGTSVIGLVLCAWRLRSKSVHLGWRLQLIACAALSGLWSGFLPRHHYGSDALLLLLFATLLSVGLAILALTLLAESERNLPLLLVSCWSALSAYAFLLFGTLQPLLERTQFNFLGAALAYSTVFYIFPSVYFFVKVALLRSSAPPASVSTTQPSNIQSFFNPLNFNL